MSKLQKKEVEESYEMTFKGLLLHLADYDEGFVRVIMDGLELYLRRNYQTATQWGAIIFDGKKFIMTSVEKHSKFAK